MLKSSESILPASTVDALKLKIKEVTKHPESAVACVEDFLYTLLGRVEVLNHSA